KGDFFGTETFSYTIEDGNGGSATAMVSVAVTPQNDPPTANDNSYAFVSNTGPYVLDVLANDTIAPDVGESLTILSTSPPDQGGEVVNQGGQLLYTPPTGIQGEVTETFTYTISDGNGGTHTATVTIDVIGYFPSSLSGNVYIDTNGDGLYGSGERGIGGVEVTLTGVDMFGAPVSLATTTPGDGSYSFADLVPGDYTIHSGQPAFMLDGVDRIGTQGGNDSVNDQLSVSIHGIGGVVGQRNYFGEQGLQPQCYSIWDFLNSSSREGVLFAIDGQSGQLWFSFLEGWDNFTSATAEISANGSTLNMTFVDQASNTSTASVPYRESAVLHFRASEGTRQLVQLVGSPSDFGLTAASGPSSGAEGLTAEGEHVPDLPGGKGPASPVSRQAQGGSASEGTLEGLAAEGIAPLAAPATSAVSPGSPALMERDLALAAVAAEGELLAGASSPVEGPGGLRYEPASDGSPDAPLAAGLPALYVAETIAEDDTDAAAFLTTPGAGAEDRLLAVDAVLGDTDGVDSWGTPFDELFGQQIGG
ncbi:MAG: Ig-like domain-containing protein, partial [Planctomycetota bacterium]